MNKGITYEDVRTICQNKYDHARFRDPDWHSSEYCWILGINIWNILHREVYYRTTVPIAFEAANPEGTTRFMGIPVEISHDHPDKIGLYKEV